MKINKVMIHTMLLSSLVFGFSSCNENKPEDTKEVAEDHNEAKFDDKDKNKDADFLVEAAELDLKEIQLGQLAQTKGVSASVKDLGKTLEKEHTESLNKLKDLAAKKQITIPTTLTDKGKEAYEKLNKKDGTEFDEEFADLMVDGHKKAIEKFEDASKDAKDEDIRAFATAGIPILRAHLDHAVTTQNKAEANDKAADKADKKDGHDGHNHNK